MSRLPLRERVRLWSRRVKRDGVTLWFALRDPATPTLARVLAFVVVAYALSPIDLIPDFIPVLGYLDDVLLLPGLIWLAVRLIPAPVLARCRAQADEWMARLGRKPRMMLGVALVVALWFVLGWGLWSWLGPA